MSSNCEFNMASPFMIQNPFMELKSLFEAQLPYVPYVYDETKIKMKNYVLNNAYISTHMSRTTSIIKFKKIKRDYLHSINCGILFVESKRPLKKLRFKD
jgi:hypothetical protein